MPERWTGELIGEMHNAQITRNELARELDCSKGYVCMVLNGQKSPKGGKERFRAAFESIKAKRKADGQRA